MNETPEVNCNCSWFGPLLTGLVLGAVAVAVADRALPSEAELDAAEEARASVGHARKGAAQVEASRRLRESQRRVSNPHEPRRRRGIVGRAACCLAASDY